MKDNNFEKLIRDSIDFGAGVFYYSKDRIENFVDQMVERGEISRYEADDMFTKLLEKGKDQRAEIERITRENIKDYLKLNEYVKKSDLDFYIKEEVKRQVENLNKNKEEQEEN
ncbi:MAG: hypothetical protein ACTIH2_03790 [Anaerococcus sp.]